MKSEQIPKESAYHRFFHPAGTTLYDKNTFRETRNGCLVRRLVQTVKQLPAGSINTDPFGYRRAYMQRLTANIYLYGRSFRQQDTCGIFPGYRYAGFNFHAVNFRACTIILNLIPFSRRHRRSLIIKRILVILNNLNHTLPVV